MLRAISLLPPRGDWTRVQPPPAADDAVAPSPAPSPAWDRGRLQRAALVAGLAQGGPLGLSFALCTLARVHGRPHLKVLGGFVPVAAAFLTAPAEQAMRRRLATQPTPLPHPSLAHDAIPGAVLFLAALGWHGLPGPPRPPPTSPAGLAATVGVSMLGSLVGGVLCEASAQHAQAQVDAQEQLPAGPVVPCLHKGMGRALSLLPLVLWIQGTASWTMAGRPLPRWTGLAGTGVACVGWTFRRLLTASAPVPAPPESAYRPAPTAR